MAISNTTQDIGRELQADTSRQRMEACKRLWIELADKFIEWAEVVAVDSGSTVEQWVLACATDYGDTHFFRLICERRLKVRKQERANTGIKT